MMHSHSIMTEQTESQVFSMESNIVSVTDRAMALNILVEKLEQLGCHEQARPFAVERDRLLLLVRMQIADWASWLQE